MSNFTTNLIRLRKYHNLLQSEIAEKMGIPRQTYQKIETGKQEATLEQCKKIAEIYDTTMDALMVTIDIDDLAIIPPPKGKHFFGTVKIDTDLKIKIPKNVLTAMNYKINEDLFMLGDEAHGLVIVSKDKMTNSLLFLKGFSVKK